MKRIAAAVALLAIVGAPGLASAATIRSADKDSLNLRTGPGTNYEVVGSLPAGQSAKVLDQQGLWYKVRTATGQEAWVAGWVSRVSYEDEQAYAVVNTDVLNVRKEPATSAAILTTIKQNDQVRLLEIVGDWWRVRLASGAEGWVLASYMKRTTAAPTQPTQPTQPTTPTTPPKPPAANVPQTPPAAPASAVPVLPPVRVLPVPAPAGAKEVAAAAASTVYAGRDKKAFEWLDAIKPGEKLTFIDAAEGWVKVTTPRGKKGWVPGQTVVVTEGAVSYRLTEGEWALGLSAAPAAKPDAPPSQANPAAPAGMGVERRMVSDPEGLRLREKPNTLGKILLTLPQGELLTVLELKMPWMRVQTSTGATGWIHSDYTVLHNGTAPAPATPAPVPAPAPAPAPLQASLKVIKPGILQLDVASGAETVGQPRAEGTRLIVPVKTGQAVAASLPVASAGAKALTVTADSVILDMEQMPGWQVVNQGTGKLSVVLRSAVTGVSLRETPGATIYEFKASGPMAPATRAGGPSTFVDFPGVTVPAGLTLPAGLKVQTADTGATFTVASRRPYSLKRTATGFELHLYTPGLAGKTILLDPGHGGPDAGAWNPTTGIREKEINLQVSLRLRAALAAKGANVLMTRIGDSRVAPPEVVALGPADDLSHVDMGWRTHMANQLKVDLFFSVHHNAGSGAGTETYYTATTLNGDRSRTMARLLQQELPKGLGQVDRGYLADLMYVTRTTDAPAVLLEIAFINHPVEQHLVGRPDYQEQSVQLMVKAIERFFAERSE